MKKEIRILGVSSRSVGRTKVLFVGVVFRGNRWLDGLFTCLLDPSSRNYLATLANRIMQSKQYSQIHAVILSRRRGSRDARIQASALAKEIRIPVISIMRKRSTDGKNQCVIGIGGRRHVYVEVERIDCQRAREIYTTGCSVNGEIPEALRVAELIIRHLG